LIILIAFALFSIYTLKTGSERFAVLDIENLNSIDDPVLRLAVEATKECNKLDSGYRERCYGVIAWYLGYEYDNVVCEKLKEELKPACYGGYGRTIGEKYSSDVENIKSECSKTSYYESCLGESSFPVGEESSKHIETEQCKNFGQTDVKQTCYEGLGRQLARDDKELSLCEGLEGKESCLIGYAYKIDGKLRREEALKICNSLHGRYAAKCFSRLGSNSIWVYNKTIKESFKDYEQYPYQEDYKQGIAKGVAIGFFEEK